MGKYASLFAEYGCGNRFYFEPGDIVPEYCPLEDCDARKGGVFEDEDGLVADGNLSCTEEPSHECPECGARYFGEEAARGCCPTLIADGGRR